jgi:predicted nucleotide-binding protein
MAQINDAQQALLEHVWSAFRTAGDWPIAQQVEVDLRHVLDPVGGIEAVCRSLGDRYIVCETPEFARSRVKLRIDGVARCASSAADVDAFLTLLRYAGEHYVRDTGASISLEGFVADTAIDPVIAKRAFKYGEIDGGRFWRGRTDTSISPDRFSRRLLNVQSLDDLHEQLRIEADAMTIPGIPATRSIWSSGDSEGGELTESSVEISQNTKQVFVVHGRDDSTRDGMFAFLRSLRLEPIEWSEAVGMTGKGSPYIGDVLNSAFKRAQAVIVLLTPDDEVRLVPSLLRPDDGVSERQHQLQPRPNVLFEAGMAFGYREDRTILVELGSPKPFTDISGRHTIRLNDSKEKRKELVERLRTAGCDLDSSGAEWLHVGSFDVVRRAAIGRADETVSMANAVVSAAPPRIPELSKEAATALIEAIAGHGEVRLIPTMGATVIHANGKALNEPADRRSVAIWRAAINELVKARLFEQADSTDHIYFVTKLGYEVADRLKIDLRRHPG